MMPSKYKIIYCDPPWYYRDKASAGERGSIYKYPQLSIFELQQLPISEIAADNSVIFLWATMPLLPQAFSLLSHWGFAYKTVAFVWIKTTKHGKLCWGMGNYTRSNAELVLLGLKGKLKRKNAGVHQVVMAPRRDHSKKPIIIRDHIVHLYGRLKRIELFATAKVQGWDSLGFGIDNEDIRKSLLKLSRSLNNAK